MLNVVIIESSRLIAIHSVFLMFDCSLFILLMQSIFVGISKNSDAHRTVV